MRSRELLTSGKVVLKGVFRRGRLAVNVHALLLLNPSFLPFVFLSFTFLSKDCLEVLGAAVHVLGVVGVLERPRILEV